ncbi:endonuclease/exonuclease/phosphatase family protein [Pontibacter chinhatensis]|nr:endonuclease/exonuclease/phosphatase family protein [Pontibacter chinhatensis]
MKRLAILYTFILGACVALSGCASSSTAVTQEPVTELRVMSYNIHHANPPIRPGVIDLDAIARVIREQNPDLVALQEVDVNTSRSGNINQAVVLAEKLGMNFFFARAIDFGGGEYGVAILSRYPLSETSLVQLPEDAAPEAEDRVLATANVTLPGGKTIRFGSTHLDVQNAANRLQQVQTINRIAAQEHLPFILAGDFNDLPESAAIAELDKAFTRTCQSDCAPTIPVDVPTRAIDFIAFSKASGFKVVSQQVIPERYASDHLPVVATLRF